MTSTCEPEFWELYNALPRSTKELADEKFKLWKQDPTHPGLCFKPVKGTPDWWSVRVGATYRAICIRDGDFCNWFFIGNHRDYEGLVP